MSAKSKGARRPPRPPHPPVVMVTWKDACQVEASAPGTPVDGSLALLTEVGFLAGEDEEAIVLAMENDSSSELIPGRWRLNIPKAMIVSVDLLVRARRATRTPAPAVIEGTAVEAVPPPEVTSAT